MTEVVLSDMGFNYPIVVSYIHVITAVRMYDVVMMCDRGQGGSRSETLGR